MGTNKMIVLNLVNGDKVAVRLSDIVEIRKTTYVNTLRARDEGVNVKTVRNPMTVTDDFYYILNAVNNAVNEEECKYILNAVY